jgi:hypothetical protein
VRVVQVLLDEGPDTQYEGLSVSFRGEGAIGVKGVGDQRRDEADGYGS